MCLLFWKLTIKYMKMELIMLYAEKMGGLNESRNTKQDIWVYSIGNNVNANIAYVKNRSFPNRYVFIDTVNGICSI